MKTIAHPEPSVQECLAEDGSPTECLLRLTEFTLLLTPEPEEYGNPIPRRRAQRAADYADAWADDIAPVEVDPVASWAHRSVSYTAIIRDLGRVASAIDWLDNVPAGQYLLSEALCTLAADVRTFAGLESPVSDSDPQRNHFDKDVEAPADEPTDAEIEAAAVEFEQHEQFWYGDADQPRCECGFRLEESQNGNPIPSFQMHQARAALVAARKAARHE